MPTEDKPATGAGYIDLPGQGPIKSFDGIYRQWFTSRHRLLSQNKGGQVPGHFVKMDGDSVTATAVEKDDKAKFHLHNFTERRNEQWYDYYILENQVSGACLAVNPEDDTITVKRAEVRGLRTIAQVKKANLLDVMFIKEQKKALDDHFWFESCIEDDKKRVLGFDQNGMVLKTTEVEPGSKESLLEMKRVWMEES
ncbi:uncharacterized protein LOC111334401 [Stylophora pistillata]|uniref:Uncharacterized protein n=1 Tax=Stylophora pistillata TaxID=50429 RepID=A0A2B4RV41_STYPI|nr:uncharacterized protein LOC111334401 [Stylophora pistillata]PFX22314.1 hypothetical protein AWC38_SpisGene13142 [Stylophora pistillata]